MRRLGCSESVWLHCGTEWGADPLRMRNGETLFPRLGSDFSLVELTPGGLRHVSGASHEGYWIVEPPLESGGLGEVHSAREQKWSFKRQRDLYVSVSRIFQGERLCVSGERDSAY